MQTVLAMLAVLAVVVPLGVAGGFGTAAALYNPKSPKLWVQWLSAVVAGIAALTVSMLVGMTVWDRLSPVDCTVPDNATRDQCVVARAQPCIDRIAEYDRQRIPVPEGLPQTPEACIEQARIDAAGGAGGGH